MKFVCTVFFVVIISCACVSWLVVFALMLLLFTLLILFCTLGVCFRFTCFIVHLLLLNLVFYGDDYLRFDGGFLLFVF